MTSWAAKYIGIPFVDDGSDWNGCNCWGLVRLVLWTEKGIMVPRYGEISASDLVRAARAMTQDSALEPWKRVAVPQPFDVVLMYAMNDNIRLIGHAGIMSSDSDVLHVWKKTDAVNVALTHPRMRHKIVGFYRHDHA